MYNALLARCGILLYCGKTYKPGKHVYTYRYCRLLYIYLVAARAVSGGRAAVVVESSGGGDGGGGLVLVVFGVEQVKAVQSKYALTYLLVYAQQVVRSLWRRTVGTREGRACVSIRLHYRREPRDHSHRIRFSPEYRTSIALSADESARRRKS